MELYYRLLLLVSERAPLDVGSKIIGPPEPTALPAPAEACTAHSFKCGPVYQVHALMYDAKYMQHNKLLSIVSSFIFGYVIEQRNAIMTKL